MSEVCGACGKSHFTTACPPKGMSVRVWETINNFETHPIGTAERIKRLQDALMEIADTPEQAIHARDEWFEDLVNIARKALEQS